MQVILCLMVVRFMLKLRIPLLWLSLIVITIVFAGSLSACSSNQAKQNEQNLPMVGVEILPPEIRDAPAAVRQAYQFAAANPDVLKAIPCYCGCGAMGHTDNYSCYVSEVQQDGEMMFDNHSLGCSICVDITQDTMRLLQQGKSVAEIKDYVDQTYSRYGPSNMP
jgi:hypothetical protein